MEKIHIQTSQNIELDFELAGMGDRIIAYLLDILVLVAYSITIAAFSGILHSTGGGKVVLSVLPFLYLPVLFYPVLMESFFNGQTVGKKLRNIRVIKMDGSPAGVGAFILRWLFSLLEIGMAFGSVAVVAILISGKGQRIGDMAAGTTVVRTKKTMRLEETILTQVDENYNPVFNAAASLNDSDVEVLKEVLRARPEEDPHGILRYELAKKAQKKIEQKLGITSGMEAHSFLSTILKDYNYLKGRVN